LPEKIDAPNKYLIEDGLLARYLHEQATWEVDADRRELRANGRSVPIGSRAFEIIAALAEASGRFVSKDELVERVWRNTHVDENTLRVHIHAIRKALGEDRALLKTSSGEGYRLTGTWTKTIADGRLMAVNGVVGELASNIPALSTDLIGRVTDVANLQGLMSAFRVVTVLGPGGIGKTTLALQVARNLASEYRGAAYLVELASLYDPELLALAVGSALGLAGSGASMTSEELARAIGTSRVLLVLDNCEHLIDATARLCETVVQRCPHLTILATSRELMKIEGERVHRLAPLVVPEEGEQTPEELLRAPSVELFVRRIVSLDDRFSLTESNSRQVLRICRQLDGIPLAIEFAASRAATLGIPQVLDDLRSRLAALSGRRRTAIPRHRTLKTVLDWSYDLLPSSEQEFLRKVAVFAGLFSLDDARTIASPVDAAEEISSLLEKSLLVLDQRGSAPLYRLLETTRAYAIEKAKELGELEAYSQAHAEAYLALLRAADTEWHQIPAADLEAKYGWRLDNIRSAIAWTSVSSGKEALAVDILSAAIPFWMYFSLYEECREALSQALKSIDETDPRKRERMVFLIAFACAALNSGGDRALAESACVEALRIAEEIGDVDHQLKALYNLNLATHESVEVARLFQERAVTHVDELIAHRMLAVQKHLRGDQTGARVHADIALSFPSVLLSNRRFRFMVAERPVSEETGIPRTLWLQGCFDEAIDLVRKSVSDAMAAGHANSLCHFLGLAACPIALSYGNRVEAQRYVSLLADQSKDHSLVLWRSWSIGYEGMAALADGDPASAHELLASATQRLNGLNEWRSHVMFEVYNASALSLLGRYEEALALIQAKLVRLNRQSELWIYPEMLRVRGEILMRGGGESEERKAEASFREATAEARRQGALTWELRSATGLAQLLRQRGLHVEAAAFLQPIHARFVNGHDALDARLAADLLEQLA